MKTELKIVTPALARQWLKANTSNRPLRPGVVERFADSWSRGEWKTTHQGIAFGTSGRLLDGQHRLTFISQLPDGSQVALNVTSGQDESTFDAIDQGFVRTMSDIYNISAESVSTARFIARIANGGQASGLTHQFVKPFMDYVRSEFEALTVFCPAKAPIWSSAPVRSAAVYQIKRGHDTDFVQLAYHSLVRADFNSMPSACQVLAKQHQIGKISSSRGPDLFLRAVRAFDSRNTNAISKILLKDPSGAIAEVRDFINADMKKSPASAGQMVAKPSRNSTRR